MPRCFCPGVTIASTAVAVIEVLNNPCILALGTNSTDVEIAASTRLDMPDCSVAANSISSTAIELRSSTSAVAAATLVTAGEISLQGTPIDPAAPPPQFALSSPAMIGAASVADPYAGILSHGFLIAGMPAAPSCASKTTGQLTIYSGNCAIPGKSLTDPQILAVGEYPDLRVLAGRVRPDGRPIARHLLGYRQSDPSVARGAQVLDLR